MKFKLTVEENEWKMGWVKIPWYYGRSYTQYYLLEAVYYPIPINFIIRYFRYMWYGVLVLILGPEKYTIMNKEQLSNMIHQAHQRAYAQCQKDRERGRI